MKILLLRQPIFYGASSISKVASPGGYLSSRLYCEWLVRYPPLGLLYYGALLKQRGHTVQLIDGELMGYTHQHIVALAQQYNPDIVISTINIYNPRFEFDLLKHMKEKVNCLIIARGHFVSLYPEETIKNNHIDFALTGKGFHAVVDLVNTLESNQSYASVRGIIYRQKGGAITKTENEALFDFNAIPFPARELVDNRVYTSALTKYDLFTTLTTTIGCPFSCTYCVDKNIPYQVRNIDNVIAEIDECINKFKIKEITFLDSTFSIDRERTVKLCRAMIDHKLRFKWAIRTHADLVDEELLSLFKDAGCISIHYGIEAGNETILSNIDRRMTLSQIQTSIEKTYALGIETLGFFMVGNQGETKETVRDTIQLACTLPLHIAQFNVAFPVPTSNVFEATQKTLGVDIWLESYKGKEITREMCKPQNTSLTVGELQQLTNEAYRRFYLRPKQIGRLLTCTYVLHIFMRQIKILFLLLKQKMRELYFTTTLK